MKVAGNIQRNKVYSPREKILGALFYAVSSILITVVNKYVLTIYQFPSALVLALCQFLLTIILLLGLRWAKIISFPFHSISLALEVFPLPFLFLGNAVCGLAGTQMLSIPMFAVLRRLTIVFTLILENVMLGYAWERDVVISVVIMMLGSVVAAIDDLSFDLYGYFIVLLNNLFTSLNGVYSKIKLNGNNNGNNPNVLARNAEQQGGDNKADWKNGEEERENFLSDNSSSRLKPALSSDFKELGTWGLMFYNSLFASPMLVILLMLVEPNIHVKLQEYEHWNDVSFLIMFSLSVIIGPLLQLSIFYCTQVNSALATNITGCLKNVVTTYIGMLAPNMDYNYSLWNFLGVNISMLGGIVYARVEFMKTRGPT